MYAPADIHAWCGSFASPQLAFAHLLDAADRAGVAVDMGHVEVIGAHKREARIGHYFADPAAILAAAGAADTLVLMFPEAANGAPFGDTALLAYLGVFAGRVARPDAGA